MEVLGGCISGKGLAAAASTAHLSLSAAGQTPMDPTVIAAVADAPHQLGKVLLSSPVGHPTSFAPGAGPDAALRQADELLKVAKDTIVTVRQHLLTSNANAAVWGLLNSPFWFQGGMLVRQPTPVSAAPESLLTRVPRSLSIAARELSEDLLSLFLLW
mmetsp:Transcript_29973/g.45148  ORF Transcript_29973/g.45148 Transcript_29973/m.45148 type:complete len:158 (+) Transcript_29973:81-554(+)